VFSRRRLVELDIPHVYRTEIPYTDGRCAPLTAWCRPARPELLLARGSHPSCAEQSRACRFFRIHVLHMLRWPARLTVARGTRRRDRILAFMSRAAPKADLFTPVVEKARLEPRFVTVAEHGSQAPARAMLRRVYGAFPDADRNFVEQFQTSGFDARTFELFLFAYLSDTGFAIDRSNTSPDFMCERNGVSVALEATTANPSGGQPQPTTLEAIQARAGESEEDTLRRVQHELPIRFGSALYSKLNDRYWELDHVAGKPLVIAIESFASADAFTFSDTALGSYLYGLWAVPWRTAADELVVTNVSVSEHRNTAKVIPSAFFDQPDSENISAVLFSNTGTAPKFGRMAVQGGMEAERVRMFRYGACYDHDPNASEPLNFAYEVARRPEQWGFPES
jgi:hypothetical protein